MKKTFLFLTTILTLLLVSCSNDNDFDAGQNDQKTQSKLRWYGVKKGDEPLTRGVADRGNLWSQGDSIVIKFLNEPSDPKLLTKVKSIAREWEEYAGISFKFQDDNSKKAAVRIAFDYNGNDWLTWSYTGTNAKVEPNQNKPTAVFGGLEDLDEKELRGDVLRVFGQILGLEYEQRHQKWTFWKNETKIKNHWMEMFEGLDMEWDVIQDYVFTPLSGENAIYPTMTTEIDEESIMAWPQYTSAHTTKKLVNNELSDGDKAFIATLYPKDKQQLPTIQEAWVDAGYFDWTDETKTSLRITDLGKEYEYLPDVRDGEQLTSGKYMFFGATSLHKAPKFNTSNITDFEAIFIRCYSLVSVPDLDTSNGTNFSWMFSGCESLVSVPDLDTSQGTDFSAMFNICESLISVPDLDTSNGTNFSIMFIGCKSLVSVPDLDTSKGQWFNYMFSNCSSLDKKPNLDLSNAKPLSNGESSTKDMYQGTKFENDPL